MSLQLLLAQWSATIDLGCRHGFVAQEVADDLEQDTCLEQMHALGVPEGVQADRLRETRAGGRVIAT